LAAAAAPTVKRVAQELGGKSANIVLPDANLAAAARWSITRGFFNSGQSCHAPSRILVHEDQLSHVTDLLVQEAQALTVGDPTDPDTDLGPVVNKSQFDRIQHYIGKGIAEGARLAVGGAGRPPGFNAGYFVRPTVFADVTPDMTIAREEIFGPVLSVMPYGTEDEAIRIANGTPYGLGGYVFASTPEKALAVARKLRAGRVAVNGAAASSSAPMGGYKQSGNGREMGVFGLEEYLETKAIFGVAA
jgi:aldehyde dehydrogenase (NAD+)